MKTRRSLPIGLLLSTALTACGPGPAAGRGSGGEQPGMPLDDDAPDGDDDLSGSADSDTDQADLDDDADDCPLGCGDGEPIEQCDLWAQDCPAGQKCTPAISPLSEGGWDIQICVDLIGEQDLGEPCSFVDGDVASGRDDCKLGAMCWNTDEFGAGHCIGLCQGSESNPGCESPMAACVIAGSGKLPICLPSGCDPLDPLACPGELCVPNFTAQTFTCALDASGNSGDGGAPGGTCEAFINVCSPGTLCTATADYGADCPAGSHYGCCSLWRDTTTGEPPCQGVGQTCVSFFAEGETPWPDFEHLGLCMVPS